MDDIKLNRVSIYQRPKLKIVRKKIETNDSQEFSQLLEEPEEKIKLFERAVGYFNADKDDENQKNDLNQSVEKGPPYVCKICQSWFYLGSKLKVHYILNHAVFHCDICSILFHSKTGKEEHLMKFHRPIFCEICQGDFGETDRLLAHYETEHNSSTCVFCGLLVQPKSLLQEHLSKKHQVNEDYLMENGGKFPFIQMDKSEFFCSLCSKKRSSEVMFGHMFSFHKMALTSLMNLLAQTRGITCDGSDKNLIKCDVQQQDLSKCCTVCNVKYAKKNPEEFHLIYCHGRFPCKFCKKYFSNIINRDKHVETQHNLIKCDQGCEEMSTLENLTKHYLTFHENVACNYCDLYINYSEINDHLKVQHKYKSIIMKNFKDSLFEIMDQNNKHIVVCCLCDENITLLTEQPKNIYLHYEKIHQMSPARILQLCAQKPILEEYEQLYREINEQINSETGKIKQESDSETDSKKDFTHLESEIESDYDYEESEVFVVSDFEEDSAQFCEICAEELPGIFQKIKHLKEKHKMRAKYEITTHDLNETKCRECNLITANMSQHVREAHKTPENLLNHGIKCQKCDLKFWTKQEINQHETKHDDLEFFQCFSCDLKFTTKTVLKDHCTKIHLEGPQFQNFFYKCSQCFLTFPSVDLTRAHFRRFHPFLKLFKCPVPNCYKTTKRAKYLSKHLKSPHNFEKKKNGTSRTCDVCQKEFKTFRAASIHKLMKHQRKLYFGFQCRICQEKFQTMEQRYLLVDV